jgi:hypothetical protein
MGRECNEAARCQQAVGIFFMSLPKKVGRFLLGAWQRHEKDFDPDLETS